MSNQIFKFILQFSFHIVINSKTRSWFIADIVHIVAQFRLQPSELVLQSLHNAGLRRITVQIIHLARVFVKVVQLPMPGPKPAKRTKSLREYRISCIPNLPAKRPQTNRILTIQGLWGPVNQC